MTRFSRNVAACLVALPVAGLGFAADALTVSFTDDGTFSAPSVTEGIVTVTGSADVNVLNFNGLGVVGGVSDDSVDIGESLTFTFSVPVTDVSLGRLGAATGDQFTLDGFDANGGTLGPADTAVDVGFTIDVSGTLGNVPLTSFTIATIGGTFARFSSVTFTEAPVTGAVPLPLPALLLLSGLAGLALGARRR